MSDQGTGPPHWSFWAIGGVALLWNLGSVMNFFMQLDPDAVAKMSESARAIVESRPAWVTGAFGLVGFGGSIGSVLLLLRKFAAYYLFIASLVGVIVQPLPLLGMADSVDAQHWVGMLMSLVVAVLLIRYSKFAQSRGWIG